MTQRQAVGWLYSRLLRSAEEEAGYQAVIVYPRTLSTERHSQVHFDHICLPAFPLSNPVSPAGGCGTNQRLEVNSIVASKRQAGRDSDVPRIHSEKGYVQYDVRNNQKVANISLYSVSIALIYIYL